jgi:hypothetical protein
MTRTARRHGCGVGGFGDDAEVWPKKIEQLRRTIESGAYRVPALDLAQSLIDDLLQTDMDRRSPQAQQKPKQPREAL